MRTIKNMAWLIREVLIAPFWKPALDHPPNVVRGWSVPKNPSPTTTQNGDIMAKHIHVFIDDEERQQELIAIRHIERTLKPLQERVRKFKEWAETQAELAAKGDIPGTVVTLELG